MPKVLMLLKSNQDLEDLKQLFKNNNMFDIHVETTSSQARECLDKNLYDIILVDYPFFKCREELLEYQSYIQNNICLLILMTNKELCISLTKAYPSSEICILEKPNQKETQQQLLIFIKTYAYLIQKFEKRQMVLLRKLKEMKHINQAKCLLVQHECISEQAAHKKIEQDAMNDRKKRYEVAQEIIYKYQQK